MVEDDQKNCDQKYAFTYKTRQEVVKRETSVKKQLYLNHIMTKHDRRRMRLFKKPSDKIAPTLSY